MGAILIVDDDAEIRRTLSLLLAGTGAVLEAADGPEALRKIAAEKPALVLLDISMPGMGGIEVLQSALTIDPSLIVLMLTSESDISIAKTTLDLGARAYITKPFDGPALRGEVEDRMAKLSGAQTPAQYKPWRVA